MRQISAHCKNNSMMCLAWDATNDCDCKDGDCTLGACMSNCGCKGGTARCHYVSLIAIVTVEGVTYLHARINASVMVATVWCQPNLPNQAVTEVDALSLGKKKSLGLPARTYGGPPAVMASSTWTRMDWHAVSKVQSIALATWFILNIIASNFKILNDVTSMGPTLHQLRL